MDTTILVVDDDVPLTRTIDVILREANFLPLLAHTAEEGLQHARRSRPDLALLDVMVPDMGGWELCRRLREFTQIPIVFLTALDDTENVVRGLELGADDYLVKPFKRAELLARIRAHLRRARHEAPARGRIELGGGELVVDLNAYRVLLDGREIDLTPREFELLASLARNAGRVMTTKELVHSAWGAAYADATDNVKPYIHYLRKKLEPDPANPRWIKTARGVGYRLVRKPNPG